MSEHSATVLKSGITPNYLFLPTYGLGTGPLKLAVASVFDNQYVKWLVWYGIPGLIIHLVFFGILAINLYKIYLKKRNPFSTRSCSDRYATHIPLVFNHRCIF